MLAQGLKQLYTSGLHMMAPRPAFLKLAREASQIQSASLYSSQLVMLSNKDILHIDLPRFFLESIPFFQEEQVQGTWKRKQTRTVRLRERQ
jgi:hypothetical protein